MEPIGSDAARTGAYGNPQDVENFKIRKRIFRKMNRHAKFKYFFPGVSMTKTHKDLRAKFKIKRQMYSVSGSAFQQ